MPFRTMSLSSMGSLHFEHRPSHTNFAAQTQAHFSEDKFGFLCYSIPVTLHDPNLSFFHQVAFEAINLCFYLLT